MCGFLTQTPDSRIFFHCCPMVHNVKFFLLRGRFWAYVHIKFCPCIFNVYFISEFLNLPSFATFKADQFSDSCTQHSFILFNPPWVGRRVLSLIHWIGTHVKESKILDTDSFTFLLPHRCLIFFSSLFLVPKIWCIGFGLVSRRAG